MFSVQQMDEGKNAVWMRVLKHLRNYHAEPLVGKIFAGHATITQDGVGQAAGISRAHASLELGHLRNLGMVEERLGHVAGTPRQVKLYFITKKGIDALETGAKPLPHAQVYRSDVYKQIAKEAFSLTPRQAKDVLQIIRRKGGFSVD